ncbi:abortive infection protein [Paludibaculum fermentans]|uniref:abortive infection protein n=1 Tax=Paludibaculum fermentans TaxID=1473598 RepID=UPI003EB9058B
MRLKGVNYDVGIYPFGETRPSRPIFDPDTVRREIEIIRRDLHCNAIRIVGRDLSRLMTAAEYAIEQGLEVWFGPGYHDADEEQTLAYFAECAQAAESLRLQAPRVVFITGWELTFFMKGLVLGETGPERVGAFMKPWKLLWSTLRLGPFNRNLNRFLERAVDEVRRHFHGPVTYSAGAWEDVDWNRFDFVSIDCYRDAMNQRLFRQNLRKYFAHGKPVVMTEFGCCTYKGAEKKGGYGWAIVDWSSEPPRLKGAYVRDEETQSKYLIELLQAFTAEEAEGAFAFTFVMPKYPYSADPRLDLDMASYGLVKSYADRMGSTYPDMPWDPKLAFRAVADYYAKS